MQNTKSAVSFSESGKATTKILYNGHMNLNSAKVTVEINRAEQNPAAEITAVTVINTELSQKTDVKSSKEGSAPAPAKHKLRRNWISTERISELRHKAQDAIKHNKTFTIRGCFSSVRSALNARGWVEKLDAHRKHALTMGLMPMSYDDLTQTLPKRKPGETRDQYVQKCEQNIMSRFLEHMPIDFLWTNRKEKCDYIDQTRNPGMTINKFQRAPFTSKEGLCTQLRDFHWFFEEGTAEMCFPRCFNVWSPEELGEFIENYRVTACIALLRWIVDKSAQNGVDFVFSPVGKMPLSSVDFAYKRCREYIDCCQHNDIDLEEAPKVWENDWETFLRQQQQITAKGEKILTEKQHIGEEFVKSGKRVLENLQKFWPQYSLDGYQNLWIIKPANKCRGRGIQLSDNLKDIINVVKPLIVTKNRYVVQKYIERPLIIHRTKFDIRQWFLVSNVQPLILWMYKESYLRFSSQEFNLTSFHESVHLTNHAVQKKYTNGKRDKRLPTENMWDSYSFQAYLRQIGQQDMWSKRIYPGMKKAIIGVMLASQENMDRRPNTFELFGADFMICEAFYPWLIEINSSPDLAPTTSVTGRMCPQCLEDVIKVIVDRRVDPKADLGNFELIYRQSLPVTPAYMGLNLLVKGKKIISKTNQHHFFANQRRDRPISTHYSFRHRMTVVSCSPKEVMPLYNATEMCRDKLATTNKLLTYDYKTVQNSRRIATAPNSPYLSQINLRKQLLAVAAKSKLDARKKQMAKSCEQINLPATAQRSRLANCVAASDVSIGEFKSIVQKWAFEEKKNGKTATKNYKKIGECKVRTVSVTGKSRLAQCSTAPSMPLPTAANGATIQSCKKLPQHISSLPKTIDFIVRKRKRMRKSRNSNLCGTTSANANVDSQTPTSENIEKMHAIGKRIINWSAKSEQQQYLYEKYALRRNLSAGSCKSPKKLSVPPLRRASLHQSNTNTRFEQIL